jgi:NDP-sugar pyrophosphorylase family protein
VAALGPEIGNKLAKQIIDEGLVKTFQDKLVTVKSTARTAAEAMTPEFLVAGVQSAVNFLIGTQNALGAATSQLEEMGRAMGKTIGDAAAEEIRAALAAALEGVGSDNAQGEVYLPDVLPIISGEVGAMVAPDATVVQGINTRADLAECEAVIQNRLRHALMVDGVTMPDPSRVLVDAGVTVGQDTTLWPGTVLRGATAIGEGCEIGPDTRLVDCRVGDGCIVEQTVGHDAEIGPGAHVGPYAHRPVGSAVAAGARTGAFYTAPTA